LNVLLDTNVYLAHIKGEVQGSHAKLIIDKIMSGELTVCYNGVIRMEIERKYKYYLEPFCAILEELRKLGRVADVEITNDMIEKAIQLDKKLIKYRKGKEERFGKIDCLLILLAKKHGCMLVTIEKELIEAAREEGVKAASPMDLAMSL
jgi:predicted nucleic acid-binding protein